MTTAIAIKATQATTVKRDEVRLWPNEMPTTIDMDSPDGTTIPSEVTAEATKTTTATVANIAATTTKHSPNREPMELDDSKVKNSVLGTNDPVVKLTTRMNRRTLPINPVEMTTARSINWIRNRRNRKSITQKLSG